MEQSENKTKKKRKTAIIFASKRNEAKRKRKTAILFASKQIETKRKRKTAIIFASKRNGSEIISLLCEKFEMKQKQNEKEAKASKRKRIKWNSETICKESKKNIKVGLLLFNVHTQDGEKKWKNVIFVSLRSKTRQKNFLFRFASKRNEKIGSETKNVWKRNKAKIRSINFALVGSEKFEAKWSEKKRKKNSFSTWACETHAKRISFRFEAKNFFLRNRRTLIRSIPEDRNPGVVVRSDNDFCYIRAITIKSITIPIRLEE